MIPVATVGICGPNDALVIAPTWDYNERQKTVIVECTFDKSKGIWRPMRLREDKRAPNSVSTAFATLEMIAASIDQDELVHLLASEDLERGDESGMSM